MSYNLSNVRIVKTILTKIYKYVFTPMQYMGASFMADSYNEQTKKLCEEMFQIMNQEIEREQITHDELIKKINDLAITRQQEEKNKAILQQVNIISHERKKENLKKELMSAIYNHQYLAFQKKLNSEEINVLSSDDKVALFSYAIELYSKRGMLMMLESFDKDLSIEKKREFFSTIVMCKIPHPDQGSKKSLLYSGKFLNELLEKAGISIESIKIYMHQSIAENAENRINNRNNELKVRVPRGRAQSS